MDNPDIEHLVLVYRRLALFERDYRNYKNANGYINKAIRLYEQHKEAIHSKVGVGFKLELALYRALIVIRMESGDEQGMLETLRKIENIAEKHTLNESSEERRVGKEYVRTCRSRGSKYHTKKNNKTEDAD